MNISDLVYELINVMKKHGDLEIKLSGENGTEEEVSELFGYLLDDGHGNTKAFVIESAPHCEQSFAQEIKEFEQKKKIREQSAKNRN